MRSSDIKKNKKEEEIYEEVGEEVFGEDTYQSSLAVYIYNLIDKYKAFKKTKLFIPVMSLIAFTIFFLVVLLAFSGGGSESKSDITDINIKAPKIIYLGETANIIVNVYGTGELENTNFDFFVSNSKIAEIKEKTLTGSSVINVVTAKELGTFYINVNYKNGYLKDKVRSENIAVCEKLTIDLFESKSSYLKRNCNFLVNI